MVEQSSFTTQPRSSHLDESLVWGNDDHTWENEVANADGVSFEDGVAHPGVSIPEGAVARYPLTTDAADVWGDNHGTLNGVTFVTDSAMGEVAEFDGASDITLPSLGFSGDTSISVAVQYYVTADAPGSNNFFGFGTDGTTSTTCSIRTRSDGGYRLYFWGNDLDVDVGTYYGTWSSVVITYDAPNSDRRLYHNGVLAGSDTPVNPSFNDVNYSIGGFNEEYHHGRMRNVQVFNRALTETEARNYHDTGEITG